MPTLHWVGKDKVVNHHHDVPFKLLDKQYTFNANEGITVNSSGNKIIQGDNLEVLKSLLPELRERSIVFILIRLITLGMKGGYITIMLMILR